MDNYEASCEELKQRPKKWLISGVAGFIGSNLLEKLLALNQCVVGLDNLSTGNTTNLQRVRNSVTPEQWNNFVFIQGDICSPDDCKTAMLWNGSTVDYVLHHAALGSVPKSISDPAENHRVNVDGFLNMLLAARDAKVNRFVYASSSAVYGDEIGLPKREAQIGKALSPYALSKRINELYGDVFSRAYGLPCVGLRYFNIFGPRQNPQGSYAAVIPKWIYSLLQGEQITIYGDGETSRDFCFIDDVVQANLLTATHSNPLLTSEILNIGLGAGTSLNQLYNCLKNLTIASGHSASIEPAYGPFRAGDIRHSFSDISEAKSRIGFLPQFTLEQGLRVTIEWYRRFEKHR